MNEFIDARNQIDGSFLIILNIIREVLGDEADKLLENIFMDFRS